MSLLRLICLIIFRWWQHNSFDCSDHLGHLYACDPLYCPHRPPPPQDPKKEGKSAKDSDARRESDLRPVLLFGRSPGRFLHSRGSRPECFVWATIGRSLMTCNVTSNKWQCKICKIWVTKHNRFVELFDITDSLFNRCLVSFQQMIGICLHTLHNHDPGISDHQSWKAAFETDVGKCDGWLFRNCNIVFNPSSSKHRHHHDPNP